MIESKAPFPWFGGKSKAAPVVWAALGDVAHYVEPFAGSIAVLLGRPHLANRAYHSETVNDLDGFLVNAWRAIAAAPKETAKHASWPVSEADLMARHLWLVRWREERNVERLRADPDWYDARAAGYWLYGISAWIGSGWCSCDGPWMATPDGRVAKQARPVRGKAREPGVWSKLPHLGDDGKGVHHAGAREPGVMVEEFRFHDITMPKLVLWFQYLSARLRHVRILQGDWRRALTDAAAKTLPVRGGSGKAGIFLDPPYGDVRSGNLYAQDSLAVAGEVQKWCLEHGDDPKLRIVLAGFGTEHTELERAGWRVVEWYKGGFLSGGMGNTKKNGTHQQHRERLWLSPHCLEAQVGAPVVPLVAKSAKLPRTRQLKLVGT